MPKTNLERQRDYQRRAAAALRSTRATHAKQKLYEAVQSSSAIPRLIAAWRARLVLSSSYNPLH